MRILIPAALLLAATLTIGGAARAQVLAVKTVKVAGGFSNPVLGVSPPGDYLRLFVVEENAARIRILNLQTGQVLAASFLNLSGKVGTTGERGLLGLAFHPNYAQNGKFYVNYTNLAGDTVVECYQRSGGDPNLADPTPVGTIIGPIFQPQENHNGGMLAFGHDGMLYIGMGDGGNFNDQGSGHVTGGNAQSGTTLLGKILRLDVDLAFPHVPPSNPFVGDPNVLDPIWDFGVRNPWRFTVDMLTGDLYIADVGQDAVEEIDFEPAGSSGGFNYGWRCMEGNVCTGLSGCTCNAIPLTKPIDQYTHAGACNSVTGGFVYRGCAVPAMDGTYFYADYCRRQIWSFTYDGVTKSPTVERTALLQPTGTTLGNIAGFGQDAYGEVYILDHSDGEIFKIVSSTAFPDCNGNFIDDACEIAVGAVPDLNGNNVPDDCECELATYCTAKAGLACGTPSMTSFGESSAAATNGYFVLASPARQNKSGILLYSNAGRATAPFEGGTLCLALPIRRSPAVNSGGFSMCDGEFAIDLNAFAAGLAGGNPAAYLRVPGTMVNVQWWGRDTVATGSFLSNAGEYLVCP